PHHGVALGIDFAVGPLAPGPCAVIALALTLARLYLVPVLREAARLVAALLLRAVVAMPGLALHGDGSALLSALQPTGVPGGAVLGGVMTDIGLIGVARLYWSVFAVPFGHGHGVGDVLLWLGIATAVLGGAMAFLQRHLKRMLAYSVVCHIGIMLAGIGLLDSSGLAGTELMFLAHALLTAGLFFVAGILHSDHGMIDELHLRGLGRGCWAPATAWFAATIGLVGTPYVGIYLGHGLIDDGATELGRSWVLALLWLGSALSGAALLRAGARIFLGWGEADDPLLGDAMEEDPLERAVLRPL